MARMSSHDGFKCFDVLVTSRVCFGEVSMMCGDGAVMFMMMSG